MIATSDCPPMRACVLQGAVGAAHSEQATSVGPPCHLHRAHSQPVIQVLGP